MMRRAWPFIVAIVAIIAFRGSPLQFHLPTAAWPFIAGLAAVGVLAYTPVAITKLVLEARTRRGAAAVDGLQEVRDDIAALREDLEGRFADITLAIDDLAPRTLPS
ncbi:hypothetical protein CMK11_07580, partial [Candidatus Poribacteria bacterium]|nr:hypothetical protein [Candidatus Poribacteria bacterium]